MISSDLTRRGETRWGAPHRGGSRRPSGRRLAACFAAAASLAAIVVPASAASAATAPSVESESVSQITATGAVLEAQINPGGLETTYRFRLEYGCGIAPGEVCPLYCVVGEPCPSDGPREIPLDPVTLPASSETQSVRLDLNEAGVTLEPATKYRYSVVATNTAGRAEGGSHIFTTATASAPAIESDSVSAITEHDARLEAVIDPNGLRTTYRFRLEWGCLPPMECAWIETYPLPSGEIEASSEPQSVSLDLNEAGVVLHPNTRYAYSVEASNSVGADQSEGEIFTTPPAWDTPKIEAQSVSHIEPTDATLEAQINSEGLETTYEFSIQEVSPCPEEGPPCIVQHVATTLPSGRLLGSFVGQTVSVDLNSAGVTLTPGAEYRFWVHASSSAGSAEGQLQHFSAAAVAEPPASSEPGSTSAGAGAGQPAATPTVAVAPQPRRHRRHRRRTHRHAPIAGAAFAARR